MGSLRLIVVWHRETNNLDKMNCIQTMLLLSCLSFTCFCVPFGQGLKFAAPQPKDDERPVSAPLNLTLLSGVVGTGILEGFPSLGVPLLCPQTQPCRVLNKCCKQYSTG